MKKGSDPFFDPVLAQLRWRCRRGMRELDHLLEEFLATGFAALSEVEKRRFAEILEYPDPELHAYLVGRSEPATPEHARLLRSMRARRPREA